MDARFVARALKVRHPNESWVFATEIRTTTGWHRPHNNGLGGLRVINAFAISVWPSKEYQRVAYEIKVDRSDWLAELSEPTKRSQAYYLADEFYFAVIPDIWERRDIPRDAWDCGLMEIQADGSVKIIRPSLKGPAWPMPISFIASFLRRVRDTNWKDHTVEALSLL